MNWRESDEAKAFKELRKLVADAENDPKVSTRRKNQLMRAHSDLSGVIIQKYHVGFIEFKNWAEGKE